ncbi:MAG TPA: hypothetical protein VFV10_09980, partial [Gammaproteobacteria bacterium]|nr:hypothetical protein [Gammaproteobacteria bacterium]
MTPATQGSPKGTRIGAEALLVAVVAAVLVFAVIRVPPQQWMPAPRVPVTLAGEHYRVPAGELARLETFSLQRFDEGRAAARAVVADEIGRQLDATFADAESRLPEFADWYYSLR